MTDTKKVAEIAGWRAFWGLPWTVLYLALAVWAIWMTLTVPERFSGDWAAFFALFLAAMQASQNNLRSALRSHITGE